jgi:hypothetical protein
MCRIWELKVLQHKENLVFFIQVWIITYKLHITFNNVNADAYMVVGLFYDVLSTAAVM